MFRQQMIILLVLICLSIAQEYTKIYGELTHITGYLNQTIQINNPFRRQFHISLPIQQNNKYFTFKPNTLLLKKLYSQPLGHTNMSLLERLRSPFSQRFKQIIRCDEYLYVLEEDNKILLFEQSTLRFLNRITIIQLRNSNQYTKGYKFKSNLIIFHNQFAFIVHKNATYSVLQFSKRQNRLIAHAEWISGTDIFILAQYAYGFGIYKIQQKNFLLIRQFGADFLNRSLVSIQDININGKDPEDFLILDKFSGIYQIDLNPISPEQISSPKLLWQHEGCFTMDSLKDDYAVLLCESGLFSNFIIEIEFQGNHTINTLKPRFKNQYIKDLQINSEYFLSFSDKIITFFWSSNSKHVPQQHNKANSATLAGVQLVHLSKMFHEHFLYAIDANQIYKYLIEEDKSKIYFRSQQTINRNIELLIYGTCSTLQVANLKAPQNQFCIYKNIYQVAINDLVPISQAHINLSASFILLTCSSLVTITALCLYKYKRRQIAIQNMLTEVRTNDKLAI